MALKAAVYVRVSTNEQTPASQLDVLREYAQARGFEVIEEYVDAGVSGAAGVRRPALDRLVANARRRRFDVVAITKLDRLARSVRHLVELAAEFEALGVDLVVIDQGIDTSTPSGRLLFHVLSSIAEFERDLIRERTRDGLAAARRRGAVLGRPRVLDRRARDRAHRLRRAGKTLREIAKLVGVSRATVGRALR